MIILAALLLTLGCVGLLFHPLLTGASAPLGGEGVEPTEAEHRKRVALLALRDVEYDFHAGKLDEADYRTLKAQVSAEALAALDDEAKAARAGVAGEGAGAQAERARIEAEIAELRASIRQGAICAHCGHPNPRGSRFCGECGAALAPSGAGSSPAPPGPTPGTAPPEPVATAAPGGPPPTSASTSTTGPASPGATPPGGGPPSGSAAG